MAFVFCVNCAYGITPVCFIILQSKFMPKPSEHIVIHILYTFALFDGMYTKYYPGI